MRAPSSRPAALASLAALGVVCTADAPLAHLVACTGSTGCARALADTKADALRALAARLAEHGTAPLELHLSGCPRACAAALARAPLTLLAVHRRAATTFTGATGGSGFGQGSPRAI